LNEYDLVQHPKSGETFLVERDRPGELDGVRLVRAYGPLSEEEALGLEWYTDGTGDKRSVLEFSVACESVLYGHPAGDLEGEAAWLEYELLSHAAWPWASQPGWLKDIVGTPRRGTERSKQAAAASFVLAAVKGVERVRMPGKKVIGD
jgi:hypothetical protein